MTWKRKRQFGYLVSILIVIVLISGSIYWYNKPLPSCFDGVQNQDERGVDCGGVCVQVCRDTVIPIQTLWIRPFTIAPDRYSVIGLFQNHNVTLGLDKLNYTIRVVDNLGATLATRTGTIFVNPQETFVIFEPGITTGSIVPARAFIDFSNDSGWAVPLVPKPILTIARQSFDPAADIPKLHAKITNQSVYDLVDVVVPVVLADVDGNAFTGSATVVERLGRGETREIYFTWPEPLGRMPAFIDFYPSVNTFQIGR